MGIMPGLEELAIIIIDNETGTPYGMPVRPIDGGNDYSDGDQQPKSTNILDVGPVDIPGLETDLDEFGWNSFFPGKHDPNICDVEAESLKTPEQYRNRFSMWKDNGTSLQIVWPWSFINKTMYVKSFKWKPPNAMGDIFYTVTFRELKTLTPKKVNPDGGEVIEGSQPEDRAPVPEAPAPQTYTVKDGDTLTGIAKKLGLTPWREKLYEPNKAVIGPDPNNIKEGQVLTL